MSPTFLVIFLLLRYEIISISGREAVHLQYVASLYWAVSTLCSVGYGDIHAYLISEVTFLCIFLFALATLLHSFQLTLLIS